MTTIGQRRTCKTPGCQKPATRRGRCGACYMRTYRAARAKREAAAANEHAICAAHGCNRSVTKCGRRGLCHNHYQQRWEAEKRLGPVQKSKDEVLEDFWLIAERFALPIEVAAHDAGLVLTDSVVAELLKEAKRRRIDFAVNRHWYNRMVDEVFGEELQTRERVRFIAPKEGPEPSPYKTELDDLPDPPPYKLDEVPA